MKSQIQNEPWYQTNNGPHDIKPYMWATLPTHPYPVEIISRPWPDNNEWLVNIRIIPGDPTTMRTVKARAIACFPPSNHEWYYRQKKQLGDDPNAFLFDDNMTYGIKENPRTDPKLEP